VAIVDFYGRSAADVIARVPKRGLPSMPSEPLLLSGVVQGKTYPTLSSRHPPIGGCRAHPHSILFVIAFAFCQHGTLVHDGVRKGESATVRNGIDCFRLRLGQPFPPQLNVIVK
jgi:hypothetical protein